MKPIASLIPLLALIVFAAGPGARLRAAPLFGPPPLGKGEIVAYPWVESSDRVRIPKRLLPHLGIEGLVFSYDPARPRWLVSDAFVKVYGVTPDDARALQACIDRADEERQKAEARHLTPLEVHPGLGSYRAPDGLRVLEERQFVREPHPDELKAIERTADREIRRLLGDPRAEVFWNPSRLRWALQRGEGGEGTGVVRGAETFTFRLIEFRSVRSVDRVQVSGGGSSGGPHFEEADRFAPESLVPVLARWRAAIREYERTNPVVVAVAHGPAPAGVAPVPQPRAALAKAAEATGSTGAGAGTGPAGLGARWDDAVEYVDWPKRVLSTLEFPGLREGAIAPEAVVLLGLSEAEEKGVNELFDELRLRFETTEALMLARPGPVANRYVLRTFPDDARRLREEWARRLTTLVGPMRSGLLDRWVRIADDPIGRGDIEAFHRRRAFLPGWPIWLKRGETEIEFTLKFPEGKGGNVSVEYRFLGVEDGLSGSLGAPRDRLPVEWRHLFRPEMLEPAGDSGRIAL